MRDRKKIAYLAVCIALVLSLTAVLVYGWLAPIRNSMVLIAGDIRIDVEKARYAYARMDEEAKETIISEFTELYDVQLNIVPMESEESYVIYEFVLRNVSPTDALLSMRLSEFADYLFGGLADFTAETTALELPYAGFTAKQILQIKYLRYSYNASEEGIAPADIVWTELSHDADANTYLWDFSYGKYIFGNDALFPAIRVDAAPQETETSAESDTSSEVSSVAERKDCVTIRLAVEEQFDENAIQQYYAWLTKENGYAWSRCRNALGNDDLIRHYLEKAKEGEQLALNNALRSELDSGDGFQLTIEYFEFIGENIPYNDSTTA